MLSKLRWGALLCLLALVFACTVMAEEASVITARCRVTATHRLDPSANLTDNKVTTCFRFKKDTVVTVTPSAAVYGVYLKWDDLPGPWMIQVERGAVWETVLTGGDDGFYHAYAALPGVSEPFRFLSASGEALSPLAEMIVLGEGEVPDWVQRWQPPPEKAALMAVPAHCDDELVFMGGILPLYAGERGLDVVVVYMSGTNARRRHEALDGLWACGVRRHPVFGPFRDFRTTTLADAYSKWGKQKARDFLLEMIRRFQPDVLVTHDVNGEYGHGAHRLTADVALYCSEHGADASVSPASFAQYGGWQPLKTYLHLYKQGAVIMDFDQPLARFGGKTGREVADEAFLFHISQQAIKYRAKDRGAYDCAKWGLALSLVGEDTGWDLFEHIDAAQALEADIETDDLENCVVL